MNTFNIYSRSKCTSLFSYFDKMSVFLSKACVLSDGELTKYLNICDVWMVTIQIVVIIQEIMYFIVNNSFK